MRIWFLRLCIQKSFSFRSISLILRFIVMDLWASWTNLFGGALMQLYDLYDKDSVLQMRLPSDGNFFAWRLHINFGFNITILILTHFSSVFHFDNLKTSENFKWGIVNPFLTISPIYLNPFVPNAPFLYPLKRSENRKPWDLQLY